jgi:hypothetical protein
MPTSPWVVLRLRSRTGEVLLEYSDFKGRSFGSPYVADQEPPGVIKDYIGELVRSGRNAIFLDPAMVSTITVSDGSLIATFDGLPASASRVLKRVWEAELGSDWRTARPKVCMWRMAVAGRAAGLSGMTVRERRGSIRRLI